MNRNIVITAITVIIVLGGGGAYLAMGGADDGVSEESNERTSTTASGNTEAPTFNPLTSTTTSFEAKLVGKVGDTTVNATILYDGKGTSEYSTTSNGLDVTTYITKDADYITCQGEQCFKLSSAASSSINPSDYTYSEEDNKKFSKTAKFIGKDSCPAGTCDVWQVEKDGTITKVYIDNRNRVSQLTTTSSKGEFVYTYDYKDVTITLPRNVQSVPTMP